MKTIDLGQSRPDREEVSSLVKRHAEISPISGIRPESVKIGSLKLFIGAEKRQYKFQEELDEEIIYHGKVKNRTEELDSTEAGMQQLAVQKPADEADETFYSLLTDKVMEVVEQKSCEIPITGVKDGESVRIGTKTLEDVKFLVFDDWGIDEENATSVAENDSE